MGANKEEVQGLQQMLDLKLRKPFMVGLIQPDQGGIVGAGGEPKLKQVGFPIKTFGDIGQLENILSTGQVGLCPNPITQILAILIEQGVIELEDPNEVSVDEQ